MSRDQSGIILTRGPAGGVVWLISKFRRAVSTGARPEVEDMEKQAIPAFAPEFATHACLRVMESATLMGNSPSVFTG